MDTENNIIKDIKDAKEAKKRTKEEADRAIEADKAAEERIRSLEESLPKIQQDVDAKRKKLDGVIASTFRVINTCESRFFMERTANLIYEELKLFKKVLQ